MQVISRLLLKRTWVELAIVFAVSFIGCFGLYIYSIFLNHAVMYPYLVINLLLATITLLLSWRLIVVLKYKRWSACEPLLLTFLWLIFLPSSFYTASDYIHLSTVPASTLLFTSIMFTAFIYLAFFLGMLSMYQVHLELKRRLNYKTAAAIVLIVLLGCCFAIYLGRDLRWDSWDLILNPAGVLFDISNLVLRPQVYPDMGRTIVGFFVLLSTTYLMAWRISHIQWHKGVKDLAQHIKKSNAV